jgi:hypothetical protein
MTRETKAGLVVSCSFLCLVGAVVAVKLRQKPEKPPAVADADPGAGAPAAQAAQPPAMNIRSDEPKDGGRALALVHTPSSPGQADVPNTPTPEKTGGKHHDESVTPVGATEPPGGSSVTPPSPVITPPPPPTPEKGSGPGADVAAPLPPVPPGPNTAAEPLPQLPAPGGDGKAGGSGPPPAEKKGEAEEKKHGDKPHPDGKKDEGHKDRAEDKGNTASREEKPLPSGPPSVPVLPPPGGEPLPSPAPGASPLPPLPAATAPLPSPGE